MKRSNRNKSGWILSAVFIGLITAVRPAGAQSALTYLDDAAVTDPKPPEPASLGQQPFPPAEKEPDLTPSQSNSSQLNQLFQFENTPDTCAAGEGYITGSFSYLKFPGTTKAYRYQIQGQYGFTDQIAAGAYIPVVTAKMNSTSTGAGDVGIYAQYKLDQFINPEIVDVTVQLDMILPTGDRTAMQDTGKFGVRPLILAYKDFGQHGPGDLSLYGLLGFTITTNSDIRAGIAATYQYQNLVGIFELFDQAGSGIRPLLEFTPGFAYRRFAPWEIAVGVPVGVTSGTPDWGVTFKLTYVFQN
jgi:hypothetical protein